MDTSVDHLGLLGQHVALLEGIPSDRGEVSYFAQEALRFYSIAEMLRQNDMLKNASATERQISHILGRSLLEGFFWLIYIFDKPSERALRFQEKLDAFKRSYGKFWNEPYIPNRDNLQASGHGWEKLCVKDANSVLEQVVNVHGKRLSYLYFTYRVASFDTHGNSMDALLQSAFGKPSNFTALDFGFGFDLVANHYLVILRQLLDAGEI